MKHMLVIKSKICGKISHQGAKIIIQLLELFCSEQKFLIISIADLIFWRCFMDGEPILCRVHSECLTGDALGLQRCDCGEQNVAAMKIIAAENRGVLVYL